MNLADEVVKRLNRLHDTQKYLSGALASGAWHRWLGQPRRLAYGALAALGIGLLLFWFFQPQSDARGYQVFPVPLHSVLSANYNIDPRAIPIAAVGSALVDQAIRDEAALATQPQPAPPNVQERLATVENLLKTPVGVVTEYVSPTPSPTRKPTLLPGVATSTPVPTAFRTGTSTLLPSPTATVTQTYPPNVTPPTATHTPRPALTSGPSATPTPTKAIIIQPGTTSTFTPTRTPTRIYGSSTVAPPTSTWTPTHTPTPTHTRTSTNIPAPTKTFTPTPTRTNTKAAYPPPSTPTPPSVITPPYP